MFLYSCEIFSTIVAAIAGSIASSRYKMDLFGVIFCGTLAAIGGGTLRDMLLGLPIYWIQPTGEAYLLIAVITCFLTFFIVRKYPPPLGTIRIADAVVLALFCMIGTEKSYDNGFGPAVAITMGICTGIAGGLLRDALTGNVPFVFRQGEWYATAAFLGSITFAAMEALNIDSFVCFMTGFSVTLIARLAAIHWNWNLPSHRPLFPDQNDPPKRRGLRRNPR